MPAGYEIERPEREEIALREVGRTAVGSRTARWLVAVALASLIAPAIVQEIGQTEPAGALSLLAGGARRAAGTLSDGGALAANRELLGALDAAETRLEDSSLLRTWLMPPVQGWLVGLGLGNEQAYPGLGGWLFYRPDVEYVTAPGFLEPRVLERRRRGGDAWQAAPRPDPLPALLELDRELDRRGIALLLAPTPLKPMIHPERFTRRGRSDGVALQNPSYQELTERLAEAGLQVVDLPALLARRAAGGEAQFLATDTHWTPAAMEAAADELATAIERTGVLAPASPVRLLRRPARLEGVGDIAAMLRLPSGRVAAETATVRRVLTASGAPWRPDPRAEILLLGDSFTNVYSDAELGWGAGAGLAEQLSFRLGRGVDRIALNAGGAFATREALARALAAARDRLDDKRIVVYQFACRELAFGDWRPVELPG